MAGRIEARLKELNVALPAARAPVANYVPCAQAGSLLFVSGQLPAEGGELKYVGRVGAEVSLAEGTAAARLCALNILSHARNHLSDLDRVTRVVQVQGFVNGAPGFADHPKVVNGASDLLVEVFGEAGKHSRFAVGAAGLPFNVAVEVAAILEVA